MTHCSAIVIHITLELDEGAQQIKTLTHRHTLSMVTCDSTKDQLSTL